MNKKTGFKHGIFIALTALMWLLSACAQTDGQPTVRSGETTGPTVSGSGGAAGQPDITLTNGNPEDTGETIYLYGNDFVDYIAPKFMEETGFKIEAVHYGGEKHWPKLRRSREIRNGTS